MKSHKMAGLACRIEKIQMDKPRGRPFPPGNVFGRGRPKGSRNREKSPIQHLLDEFAPHIMRKCMAQAMEGSASAMRLCVERIFPSRRGALIQLNLPPIRTVEDVGRAAEKVTQAIRRGKLTPAEGNEMMNHLEGRSRIIEGAKFETQLADLADKINAIQKVGEEHD
jgi:hypothetical protein